MTAYSFGARWVGIVAMRDSPALVPELLHKMALRLRREASKRAVRIDESRSLPADELLGALARIRIRRAVAGDEAKSCASVCR